MIQVLYGCLRLWLYYYNQYVIYHLSLILIILQIETVTSLMIELEHPDTDNWFIKFGLDPRRKVLILHCLILLWTFGYSVLFPVWFLVLVLTTIR